MKILSHAVAFPSKRVTNEDVLDLIHQYSKESFGGDLNRTTHQIDATLRRSGSNSRFWRRSDETSLAITLKAAEDALKEVDPKSVDLLICAGVYTELAEPSSANLIAHKLGLDRVKCFDVKQACDGWSKAAEIASLFIEAGKSRSVMVINAEFPMTKGMGVFPNLFQLDAPEQLEHRSPAYTLGEGAAAMVFGPDSTNPWRFHNLSRNDLWDLCTITMPWHPEQPLGSSRVAKDGPGIFTSYGADLKHHGLPAVVKTFKSSGENPEDVDILFTHSSSRRDWREAAAQIGMGNKLFDTYNEFGNVVSAAVPFAMGIAKLRGLLKRGMHVNALVASAGMSFTNTAFTY